MKSSKIKVLCLLFFAGLAVFGLSSSNRFVRSTTASVMGPVAGNTGAPGETTCTNCHIDNPGSGQFTITAPASYIPGQTYQITVRHQTTDMTRKRWGFQLTALAGATPAVAFANLNGNTQIINGAAGRKYIEHTFAGTFLNQMGGAFWTFNWTAPATNIGAVTLYAAGNQANADGTPDGDQIYTTMATIQAPPPAPDSVAFDFDGDRKTDIGIFRPTPAEWWINRSFSDQTFAVQFGQTTDRLVPADFTGDGKTDISFWRESSGQWFVLRSEDNSFYAFPFGSTGDIPAPGDFDGDGRADAAVFRPSNATWFILRSSDGGITIQQFGVSEDRPVIADYDGDGKSDIAVFRPTPSEWWILRSTAGLTALQFGQTGDKTVQGDYTGDGKADVAFWRPSSGQWFVLRSEDLSFFAVPFGALNDIPAPGDFDGDGKFDFTVFRPSQATWFSLRSTQGVVILTFGTDGDVPLQSAFIP